MCRALSRVVVAVSFLLVSSWAVSTPASAATDPLDWPAWRGPEQTGVSRETGLIDSFDPKTGENILWKREDCGGISTPICLRGKLYTIVRHLPNTPAEAEKVVCLDVATGKTIWENIFNVFLSDVPAERVGWSSCVADPTTGRIFVMGVNDYLQCLDGETGKTIWSRSLLEECGALSTYGGRTNVPVLFDNLVIISAVTTGWDELAVPAHRFLALDKATGNTVWVTTTTPRPEDTTYSTPFVTTINGQAQMIFGAGDGYLWSLQPRTGKMIWKHLLSQRGMNVSPVVDNGRVYTGQAEENLDNSMGCIAAVDATKGGDTTASGPIWRTEGMIGKSSPIVTSGRVYACDDGGSLYVVNAETGEPLGKPVKLLGTIVRASPLFADGKLYMCSTAAWHVFQPTETGLKPIIKKRLPADDEVSSSLAVSHGKIYLSTRARLYCLGKKDAAPKADPIPAAAAESPAAADTKLAQIQLVPSEFLLAPGKEQALQINGFNAKGQPVAVDKSMTPTFALKGPGSMKGTSFVAPTDTKPSGTIVTCTLGDVTAQARVRVVPPLPWKFDFEDGQVPLTWIGARYRHIVRDADGGKAMVKITTIPKGTRSQLWMGPTGLHDYTVQADVKGAFMNQKQPDAGVIAQRYTLDLMGQSQQLQIRSWTSQLGRFSKSVPFHSEPNQWYTLKFRAATDGGKAVLKGKAWKRGEPEPKEWTIEAVDEHPNLIGSPGLFGNANDSEIFVDNVLVTPNN